MPLHAGARLGPYEILEPLGAGGMGSACGHAERERGVAISRRGGAHLRQGYGGSAV